jgi:hypothetical protein
MKPIKKKTVTTVTYSAPLNEDDVLRIIYKDLNQKQRAVIVKDLIAFLTQEDLEEILKIGINTVCMMAKYDGYMKKEEQLAKAKDGVFNDDYRYSF